MYRSWSHKRVNGNYVLSCYLLLPVVHVVEPCKRPQTLKELGAGQCQTLVLGNRLLSFFVGALGR